MTSTLSRPPSLAFRAIGCECRVAVTDPTRVVQARDRLVAALDRLDRAASRFRADSEVSRLAAAGGRPTPVSALLADLLRTALTAARDTGGLVDPTLGRALVDCGYDADLADLPAMRPGAVVRVRPRARWQDVRLDGAIATVPAGVLLDLGATAKARAADLAAERLAGELDCGVLVALGGDIAVRGAAPPDGWRVRITDAPTPLDAPPDGPAQTVAITEGGLATSSTASRRWAYGAGEMHHLLDPRTGLPAVTPWRTVSATAPTCLTANVATTAAIVRGEDGLPSARATGLPTRLVGTRGDVVHLGGWPA